MKYKILVIEDNEQNRYLLTYLLEAHGYEVVSAVDGYEGIALARSLQRRSFCWIFSCRGWMGTLLLRN